MVPAWDRERGTHQGRLGVLAQLVLLRALGDVSARLECARLAAANAKAALSARCACAEKERGRTGQRTQTWRLVM